MADDIRKEFNLAVANLTSISGRIEERLILLEEKGKLWSVLDSKMKEHASAAKTKITLNVGGTKFTTLKSTLTSGLGKGSYFDAMLSSGHWQPDEDGEYFIDRDPKFFGTILNYLRTGELFTTTLSSDDYKWLNKDFDYFQIVPPALSLVPPIFWLPDFCSSSITIHNQVATRSSGSDDWNAGVLGSVANPPSFKFNLRKQVIHLLGLAPKAGFKKDGENYKTCGWYLACHSGNLYSQTGVQNSSFTTKLKEGSTLEVIFCKKQKTISFRVDGVSRGVAFTDVDASELYPAALLFSVSTEVEIMY